MEELRQAATAFLRAERVAVAGSARDGRNPANLIYRRLRGEGYVVIAVNPVAEEVEGDVCYASVAGTPQRVEGVVIATPPAAGRRRGSGLRDGGCGWVLGVMKALPRIESGTQYTPTID